MGRHLRPMSWEVVDARVELNLQVCHSLDEQRLASRFDAAARRWETGAPTAQASITTTLLEVLLLRLSPLEAYRLLSVTTPDGYRRHKVNAASHARGILTGHLLDRRVDKEGRDTGRKDPRLVRNDREGEEGSKLGAVFKNSIHEDNGHRTAASSASAPSNTVSEPPLPDPSLPAHASESVPRSTFVPRPGFGSAREEAAAAAEAAAAVDQEETFELALAEAAAEEEAQWRRHAGLDAVAPEAVELWPPFQKLM